MARFPKSWKMVSPASSSMMWTRPSRRSHGCPRSAARAVGRCSKSVFTSRGWPAIICESIGASSKRQPLLARATCAPSRCSPARLFRKVCKSAVRPTLELRPSFLRAIAPASENAAFSPRLFAMKSFLFILPLLLLFAQPATLRAQEGKLQQIRDQVRSHKDDPATSDNKSSSSSSSSWDDDDDDSVFAVLVGEAFKGLCWL